VALTPGTQIETLDLPVTSGAVAATAAPANADGWMDRPLKEFIASTVATAESNYLRRLLQSTNGSLSEAAKRAGVDRKSIYNKMKAYGLEKSEFKTKSNSRAVAPELKPAAAPATANESSSVPPLSAVASSHKLQ
jgi:DNA-binding NtrC family response regulator